MKTFMRYVTGLRLVLAALVVEIIWYIIMTARILAMEETGHRDVGGYLFIAFLMFLLIIFAMRGIVKHVYWMYYTIVAGGFMLLIWILGLAMNFYIFATPLGALLMVGGGLYALKENEKNPV